MPYYQYIFHFGFLVFAFIRNPQCIGYKHTWEKNAHITYDKQQWSTKYNCSAILSHHKPCGGHVYASIAATPVPEQQDERIPARNVEPIVHHVQQSLIKATGGNHLVVVDAIARLDYARPVILDTIAEARKCDRELTGNAVEEQKDGLFCRFDGDEGQERRLIATKHMQAGTTVISVPTHMCLSLTRIKTELFRNYNMRRSRPICSSFEAGYVNHIEQLCSLNIGKLMVEQIGEIGYDTDGVSEHSTSLNRANKGTPISVMGSKNFHCTERGKESQHMRGSGETGSKEAKKGFEDRLQEYIAVKKLQLLKTLIIADSVLSTGEILSLALECKDMKMAHLNRNERELLLLSLAMAADYHIGVVSTVLRILNDPNALTTLQDSDKVKLAWIHHLITKDMGHLPMLLPSSAVKQIQEYIISHRLRQRLLAVNDVFNAARDPLYLIQDRIEYIAQAHYKLEDTMPTQAGCGPLMDNRKIDAERALENIETELLTLEKDPTLSKLGGLFQVTREEMLSIIGASQNTSPKVDNTQDHLDILKLVEEYLTGNLEPERYKHVSHGAWLRAINSLITQPIYTGLFAAAVAHSIRIQRHKPLDVTAAYIERSYLHHAAQGISAKIHRTREERVAEAWHDEAYIVPLIDLANHKSRDANCVIEVDVHDGRNFSLKTQKDVHAGDEITVNYGKIDNNALMLDYGFLPQLKHDEGVLMDIEPWFIKKAAASRNIQGLLPKSFPAGLPLEKRKLISKLNILELPSDKNFLQLYNEPYFHGMPVEKYNEFNAKFMARELTKNPCNNEEVDMDAIKQENSEYQPVVAAIFPEESATENEPMKLVKINVDGAPDERLIPLLKICFCKTKKRLQWIEQQDMKYLATSINSPLDLEVFKVASFVCCEYIKNKYQQNIVDDLRQLTNQDITQIGRRLKASTLEDMRNCNPINIPNALIVAHALRAKIPVYKCASYLYKLATDFERNNNL